MAQGRIHSTEALKDQLKIEIGEFTVGAPFHAGAPQAPIAFGAGNAVGQS